MKQTNGKIDARSKYIQIKNLIYPYFYFSKNKSNEKKKTFVFDDVDLQKNYPFFSFFRSVPSHQPTARVTPVVQNQMVKKITKIHDFLRPASFS